LAELGVGDFFLLALDGDELDPAAGELPDGSLGDEPSKMGC